METKTARFDVRVTEEQKELFNQAAALAGYKSITEFIVTSVQDRATSLVKEHEVMMLSKQASIVFANVLLDETGPNDKLRQAAGDYLGGSRLQKAMSAD